MIVDTASIPAPGDQVAVRTHDDGARGVRGVVARIDEHAVALRLEGERPDSPAPVLLVPVEGGPAFAPMSCVPDDHEPAEDGVAVFRIRRREAFRVRLPVGACIAELPDGSRTGVLNISGDGIALQVERPPETGERIEITLSDDRSSATGAFIVRNRRTIGNGTVVGLQIDGDSARGWLHDQVVTHLCAQLASAHPDPESPPPAPSARARRRGTRCRPNRVPTTARTGGPIRAAR